MSAKRTVVLASGRGSNFQAVLDGVRDGKILNCEIVGLITDRPGTGAEALVRERGLDDRIEIHCFDFKSFPNRDTYDRLLLDTLKKFAPDLILTLGYMRLLAPALVQSFPDRIINIHPSLLPAFPGIRSQRQALEYGVKVTGTTVHFVDEGMDTGPIIDQAAVTVPDSIDVDGLSDLILIQEHRILTRAVDLFCQDRLRLVAIEARAAKSDGNHQQDQNKQQIKRKVTTVT